MKGKASHIVPWSVLILVLVFFIKQIELSYVLVMLYMVAIYALFDICRSRGNGETLLYWSLYACIIGIILLWRNCTNQDWGLALICGGALCALIALLNWIWKHLL